MRGPQPPETPTPPTEVTDDAATADTTTDVTTERPAEVTGSADDRQMRDVLGELLGGDADRIADAQARLNAPNAGEYEKQAARAVLRYRQRDGRDGVTPYETTEGGESQPLFRLRGEEKKHVERNNKRFNEELDRQIAGQLPQGHIYNLGRAGSILQSAGFPDADIELSATRLAEKARQHGFGIDDVRNLVSALQEPVAVFSYGDKAKAQNVIAEIVRDGKNFVVGVHFNQVRGNTEVSSIRGLFPKDNAEWLNWVSQGKLLYVDKEKIQTLIDQQRTNPADVDYLDLEDVAKIIKDFENPSIPGENNGETTESGGALFRVRRAPNGKESNLDERQYDEVRMGNFKKWFGDWENNPEEASKVVDANGEPLVVYHQTNRKQYINQLTACVCGCVMVPVADPLTTRQTTRLLWRMLGGGWRVRLRRSSSGRLRGLSSKPTVAVMRRTHPMVAAGQRINSNSRYLGRGHISSSTINSSLST